MTSLLRLLAAVPILLLTQCTIPGGGGGPLQPATKENPFVNSLGMKFVPVPGTNILMCTTETTVAQYQAAGMGYHLAAVFGQSSRHPAVTMSCDKASAWCAWLSKREGRKCRLPTEAEWSAAVGDSTYPWGNQWPPPCNYGNYAGQEMRDSTEAERTLLSNGDRKSFALIGGFSDRHKFMAPVGSYPANRLGLHDLGGNSEEWCEDHKPQSTHRVLRGGSWNSHGRSYLASAGHGNSPDSGTGFRCVVER